MSISSLQVTNAVNDIIAARMKKGFIPTVDYIIAQLSDFYKQVTPGYPSFQMRQQVYRKLWSVDTYNSNLTQIYNDINNFYDTIVTQFTTELSDFNYAETARAQLFNQINDLSSQVQNLILLATDTTGALYSVSDNFVNNAKIDLQYTTCAVNNDAGMVTIGESQSGIVAIDMSAYYNTTTFPIVATQQYAGNILSNTLVAGTSFGNAFNNTSGSWQQNIITSVPGDLQVYFTINISPSNPLGVQITRIEVDGQSPNPFNVTPMYSSDNINFSELPLGFTTDTISAANGITTVWNFEPISATYIKFLIDKPQDDNTVNYNGQTAYQYIIGFTNISLYQMGYGNSSDIYSEAYTIDDPNGDPLTIDTATLVVSESIPNGTNIDYYLSIGASGVTDPTLFNWVPISPINDPAPTQPQLVDFMHVSDLTDIPYEQWQSGSYGTPLLTYQGISFYEVFQFPYVPVKNSVTVYRGVNDWQVIQNYTQNTVSIYNEQHAFGSAQAVQLLYPNFTPVVGPGLIRGSIVVQNEPGTDPSYVYVTPGDYTVDYTNNLIKRSPNSTISNDLASPNNTVYVNYQYDNETALPAQYITSVFIENTEGFDLALTPWSASQITNGEFTTITVGSTVNNVSTLSSYHLANGWSTIATTGQPFTVADVLYGANGNVPLSTLVSAQYAYVQPLTEVSWFDLQYNTLITDRTKYCVTTKNNFTNNPSDAGTTVMVVNYEPQITTWITGDNLLCHNPLNNGINTEVYNIGYQFISTQTDTIYFKASMSSSSPLITPTLNSYTIKLGY